MKHISPAIKQSPSGEQLPQGPGPWRTRLALAAILLLGAALRLWQLDQNGFGREYYAAGVRSMLQGWHLFFFNAFDPAGFVSIDKPPVALWFQVAGAKLLGFSGFSVLLPQVLEGLLAIGLLFHLVRRSFGNLAGLLAALLLALTPICVAVDRSNNTDSCLVMFLMLAAWALIIAVERSRMRWIVLAMALLGIAFNVKMLAAWVIVPAWGLVYLLGAASIPVGRRILNLAVAGLVLIAVSLSWVVAFDATAPAERPYAGSTKGNSMVELALLHNGLNRFLPKQKPSAAPVPLDEARPAEEARPSPRPQRALWDETPAGVLRLFTAHMASQIAWWAPLVLCGLLAAGWKRGAWRRPTPAQVQVGVWGGWALMYGAVFSFAGGVFHTYYLAVLGPALAALAGIGGAWLWSQHRMAAHRWYLPAAVVALALWQWHAGQDAWRGELTDWRSLMLVGSIGLLCVVGIGLGLVGSDRFARAAPWLAAAGCGAMLWMPLAWSLSVVLVKPNVAAPSASLDAFDRMTEPPAHAMQEHRPSRLVRFLRTQRQDERYLVAVPSAAMAAPLIVRTGEPVMAMGGYLGHDPILTPEALERLVEQGALRFVLLGGPSLVRAKTPEQRALEAWVREHGQRVDPALWRSRAAASKGKAEGQRPLQLFDMQVRGQNA